MSARLAIGAVGALVGLAALGSRRGSGSRRPLTDEEALRVLGRAAELGLPAGGGACGAVAEAIRDIIFGGDGELIAVGNRYLWRYQYRFVGHVGVLRGGTIWDAEGTFDGPDGRTEFESWGMLDPEDEDWGFFAEDDAYGVEWFEGDEDAGAAVRGLACPAGHVREILKRARTEVAP